MAGTVMVHISKGDVLMEDFLNIQSLIQRFTKDRENLIKARNSWEVFFSGYDDDPREIPDIPEVVNWITQSVEEGIPWFYFLNADADSIGLLMFMICCGVEHDPSYTNRYTLDANRILPFVKRNMENMEKFVEKYEIPESVWHTAADEVLGFIRNVFTGDLEQEEPLKTIDRGKQIKEALERLTMLEDLFELNPKVKNYFKEGKLYYSYLTGGGYIGSIDTINYDKRYAAIVKGFEAQTSYLVYHVIECRDTIALLYVSNDYNQWLEERPSSSGVLAHVFNVESHENEKGYIKIDSFQGALYRVNTQVFSSKPERTSYEISGIEEEIAERLEILKTIGLETDLDITRVYLQEEEICCTMLRTVMGRSIGIVNRISAWPVYDELFQLLSKQVSKQFYFMMSSPGNEVAFLFLSDDSRDWENEKAALERGIAYAVVVNPEKMTATIKQIVFEIVNGGPIFVA